MSSKFLDSFPMECTVEVKQSLKRMMAAVHARVTDACEVRGQACGRPDKQKGLEDSPSGDAYIAYPAGVLFHIPVLQG